MTTVQDQWHTAGIVNSFGTRFGARQLQASTGAGPTNCNALKAQYGLVGTGANCSLIVSNSNEGEDVTVTSGETRIVAGYPVDARPRIGRLHLLTGTRRAFVVGVSFLGLQVRPNHDYVLF